MKKYISENFLSKIKTGTKLGIAAGASFPLLLAAYDKFLNRYKKDLERKIIQCKSVKANDYKKPKHNKMAADM
jgi:hypothetical protein